jgi:hypothetical protein
MISTGFGITIYDNNEPRISLMGAPDGNVTYLSAAHPLKCVRSILEQRLGIAALGRRQ